MKKLFILILLIPYISCESPTQPEPEIVQDVVEDPAEEQDIERNESVAEDEKESELVIVPQVVETAPLMIVETVEDIVIHEPVEETVLEPEIIYKDLYSLFGIVSSGPDNLDIIDSVVLVNGTAYEMEFTIDGPNRINHIIINVDSSDSFLFIGEISNMENLFGIDLNRMDFAELETAVEILRLFPEVGIMDLMEVYS